jgi:hypothetical protein
MIRTQVPMSWRELVSDLPDYEPARPNLALLGSQSKVALGNTAAVALPTPAAAVKAIKDERTPTFTGMQNTQEPEKPRDKVEVNTMGALVQVKASRFASLRAIVVSRRFHT